MAWQRLSEREGRREPDGPYEGVPEHLAGPLVYWLEARLGLHRSQMAQTKARMATDHTDPLSIVMAVANRARVAIGRGFGFGSAVGDLIEACRRDGEVFLDVVDAMLATTGDDGGELRGTLELGGSVWTVSPEGDALRRRVGPAVQRSADRAMSTRDVAGEELARAWAAAYGRGADASDAWDHAIKAAEAALIPIVVPAQKKATMGHVLGALRQKEGPWRLLVAGAAGTHDVAPLVGMLQLLWPNPDRHASGQSRAPKLEEAQAVVQLTATIVQWARDGVLTK